MKKLAEIFSGHRHVLLPVIHVEDEAQAVRETRIVHEAGCDGAFLINHAISWEDLLRIHGTVVRKFPGWWVGVNCLDLSPAEVFAVVTNDVAGVWVDNAEIDERSAEQPEAERILAVRRCSGWRGLYFGGVAFKYKREMSRFRVNARSLSAERIFCQPGI